MSEPRARGSSDFALRAPLVLCALLVCVVAGIAIRDAIRWYGRPIPGLLVESSGSVASVGLPGWEGKQRGIRFPDRIEPAAPPLTGFGSRARVRAWDQAVARARTSGYLYAVVRSNGREQHVRLALRPLEPLAWWTYAGSMILAGIVYACAALIALWSSPRGKLARAFAALALCAGVFMISFFDIHTARTLIPVYYVAFATAPALLISFMLHLPTPAPVLERYPRLQPAALLVSLAFAAVAVATYYLEGDAGPLQLAMTAGLGLGFLAFVCGFIARYARARGDQKRTLNALLLSMVPPYGALAVFLILLLAGVRFPDFFVYPALIFAPLASLYAFVRHDLWGSRALLSRIGTNLFLAALACALAIGAGAALATWMGASFRDALAGAAGSGVAAAAFVVLALRISDFTLFRSRAQYKPTIDRLSEELITLSSRADVAHAIERTVRRWLRCDFIELTLAPPEPPATPVGILTEGTAAKPSPEAAAEQPREPACSPKADLRLQVAFGGKPFGWLDVGGKRGGALFTSDDIDLLRTIANHGGLALAHAHAYQELEDRRRRQAEAWRGEREALVETVAAEIAHEIRYPLNYFRSLFERGAKSGRLTADDIDVGREEVDRLERLVAGLKRMVAHRIERSPTAVSELCARVEALLRDSLGKLKIELQIGPDATLRCDPDKLTQVLVNLMSNAMDACGPNGRTGIAWRATPQGGELSVWDDGPGFVGDSSRLFAPWYTTKPRGTGLGLAITHRLVRAHGWSIAAARREARTVFAITVRTEDIVRDTGPDSRNRDAESEVRVA
jgi:signal transduction histidine kinase